MIHDGVLSQAGSTDQCLDRRSGDRLPYPAELLLIWLKDPSSRVRYRILDAGDGGFRIRTSTPLVEGMTGLALKLLPEGDPIDRSVMVAWVGEPDESGQYEAGLRYF